MKELEDMGIDLCHVRLEDRDDFEIKECHTEPVVRRRSTSGSPEKEGIDFALTHKRWSKFKKDGTRPW